MNIKCLFQPTTVPRKEERVSLGLGKTPAPRPLPAAGSLGPEVLTTQMHSKAPAAAVQVLVPLSATEKPLFSATQIHLSWMWTAFQRRTSKCGLNSSISGKL